MTEDMRRLSNNQVALANDIVNVNKKIDELTKQKGGAVDPRVDVIVNKQIEFAKALDDQAEAINSQATVIEKLEKEVASLKKTCKPTKSKSTKS